jgi:hypothetical protein
MNKGSLLAGASISLVAQDNFQSHLGLKAYANNKPCLRHSLYETQTNTLGMACY